MPDTVTERRARRKRDRALRKHRVRQRAYVERLQEAAMPKHESLSNEELDAVLEAARLEKLTFEAQRLAKGAGLTVEQWLTQATPEDRETYKHVPDVQACWERADRETRERSAQYRPTGPGPSTLETSCSPSAAPRPDSTLEAQRDKAAQQVFQQSGILL